MNSNGSSESGTTPTLPAAEPQPSRPTEEDGAPSLGAPDRNPREIVPGVRRAFLPTFGDTQHAAWRAFGSAR